MAHTRRGRGFLDPVRARRAAPRQVATLNRIAAANSKHPMADLLAQLPSRTWSGEHSAAPCHRHAPWASAVRTQLIHAAHRNRQMHMETRLMTRMPCRSGAAYLVWLALRSLRTSELAPGAPGLLMPDRFGLVFLHRLINNLANPKIVLFYVAFLPQFVDPSLGRQTPQLWVLGLTPGRYCVTPRAEPGTAEKRSSTY
jgi:LysE type translocator